MRAVWFSLPSCAVRPEPTIKENEVSDSADELFESIEPEQVHATGPLWSFVDSDKRYVLGTARNHGPFLALFTDEDRAERFRQQATYLAGAKLAKLLTPDALADALQESADRGCQVVAFDPGGVKGAGIRLMPITRISDLLKWDAFET